MTRNLPLYVDSFTCRSGVSCSTCMDRTANGIRFRGQMAGRYQMPPELPEKCPHDCKPPPLPKAQYLEGCDCGGLSETQKATDRPEK